MSLSFENSGFENIEANTVIPRNASITELLSYQSSNSIVYKTRINDKWLLLKRILPEFREHPVYINALEKEFNLGFNLDHPNIVKYLNKGQDSEGLYLIAEFIDGSSLRNIIQKNTQGINDIKLIEKIIFQLLDALSYLHKQQIFHLDLKPENIIITHKGNNVKIIDFGLSGSDSYISVSSGTRKYCSPEQITNPQISDARSDLYSLGIIFLELLTGNTDLSGLKKLPSRYKKVISKCIEPLQENRFNSADEIIEQLNKKSKAKIFLFSGIIALLLICTIFGVKYFHTDTFIYTTIKPQKESVINKLTSSESLSNAKVAQNIIDKNNSNQNSSLLESKRRLDSISKEQLDIFNKALPNQDSIFCCRLGNQLFSTFINQVKLFDDNPTNRSWKSVLIELKEKCYETYLDSLHKYLSKYELGSVIHSKLTDLARKHSDYSELRIDSIVWKK